MLQLTIKCVICKKSLHFIKCDSVFGYCGILLAFVRTRENGVSSRNVVSRTIPHFSQSMLTPMKCSTKTPQNDQPPSTVSLRLPTLLGLVMCEHKNKRGTLCCVPKCNNFGAPDLAGQNGTAVPFWLRRLGIGLRYQMFNQNPSK